MNKKTVNNTAYLSLGSNKLQRENYIQKAKELLKKKTTITELSLIYESDSWGYDDNPYLNQCLTINTDLNPVELLEFTQNIESCIGRKEKTLLLPGNTPLYRGRIIDIDILFYSNKIIKTKNLIIPHPKLHLRKFVLLPLIDIAPTLIHPEFNESIQDLYNKCSDKLSVYLYKK